MYSLKGLEMNKTALLIVVSAFAGVSQATVAFSTFGPGDSYNAGTSYTIGAPGTEQDFACQFVSAESGVLSSVELALTSITVGDINIFLYEDNSDTIGSQMIGWGHTLNSNGIFTFNNPFPSVQLTAGNKYWLEVQPIGSTMWGGWFWNDQSINGLNHFSDVVPNDAYFTGIQSAYRVNVDAVPEPATMTVLALGALAALKRRKK